MIDVRQNTTLSESLEGDRWRVIGNCCNQSKIGIKCSIDILFCDFPMTVAGK